MLKLEKFTTGYAVIVTNVDLPDVVKALEEFRSFSVRLTGFPLWAVRNHVACNELYEFFKTYYIGVPSMPIASRMGAQQSVFSTDTYSLFESEVSRINTRYGLNTHSLPERIFRTSDSNFIYKGVFNEYAPRITTFPDVIYQTDGSHSFDLRTIFQFEFLTDDDFVAAKILGLFATE